MPLDLSRLQRCDQDWEAMTPTARGRLCAGCSREIVDFRGMSDAAVARIHVSSPRSVCGLYSEAQRPGGGQVAAAAAMAIGVVALLPNAAAAQQRAPGSEATEVAVAPAADTVWLRGTVMDSVTSQPLPGAIVAVQQEPHRGTVTDGEGRFRLDVGGLSAPFTLRIMLIGYGAKDVEIERSDAAPGVVVELAASEVDLIAFYVTVEERPSLLRRIWRFISGS